MKYSSLSCLLFLIAALGCSEQSKQNSGQKSRLDKVDEIIDRAIDWAGGMDRWHNLEKLSYTKRSRLLYENDSVEYDITQRHDYIFYPSLTMDIQWETGGDRHRIFYTDTASFKYLNDSIIERGKKVDESAMSALYVLGMPFKLRDQGSLLTYEGQQAFQNRQVDVIKATYSPQENDNHSTSDTWWYYFDTADGAFLGCMVHHAPTYALIENLAFEEVEGLKFQKRRMSYRSDSLRNKQYLRAEFWYEDYAITYRDQ